MPEKKLRLTRKEFREDLPNADRVVLIHGDEKAPEGQLGINIGVAKACYFALLDPTLLHELCRQVEFQPPGFRINKMDPAELFVQLVRHVQRKGYGTGPLVGNQLAHSQRPKSIPTATELEDLDEWSSVVRSIAHATSGICLGGAL
jgi:hypothetical protein